MNPWEMDWSRSQGSSSTKPPWEQDWSGSSQTESKPDAIAINEATGERRPYYSDVPLPPGMQFDPASLPAKTAQPPTPPPRTLTEKLFGVPRAYNEKTGQFRPMSESGETVVPGAESLQWLEKNPDIALATVGSVLAPEVAVLPYAAAELQAMPFVKQMLLRAAMPFVKNAPSIAAATGGGGMGGAIKEAMRPEDGTPKDIGAAAARSATEMGLAELFGTGLTAGLQKVFAPNAGNLTKQYDDLLEFATKNKLPLNPSDVTTGKTAKVVEGIADIGVPGRFANQRAYKEIAKQLDTSVPEANNLIAKTIEVEGKRAPGSKVMGESLRTSLEEALARTGDASVPKRVDAKYKSFVDAIGGKARVSNYENLQSVMRDIEYAERKLAGGADDATLSFIDNFKSKHANGITAHDLYEQYKRLNKVGGESRNLGALRDAFKQEFEKLGAESGDSALTLLNEAHKSSILFDKYLKNNRTLKSIVSGAVPDDQITVRLFQGNPESINTLKYLRAHVPKETFDDMLTQNLANMIKNNSKSPAGTFARYLDGAALEKVINKNRKVLEAFYPPQTVKAMDNLALYAKANAESLQLADRSWAEALAAPASIGGAVGLFRKLADLDPTGLGVIIPEVASYPVARSLMKPDGVMFQWLTKGAKVPEAVNQGLMLGGRAVFQDASE